MRIDRIFAKCMTLTMKKRQDYTTDHRSNNHENFQRSAIVGSWFLDEKDKPYAILVGTKLARLGSLLGTNKDVQNESIEDTFLDLINYCALWMERQTESGISQATEGEKYNGIGAVAYPRYLDSDESKNAISVEEAFMKLGKNVPTPNNYVPTPKYDEAYLDNVLREISQRAQNLDSKRLRALSDYARRFANERECESSKIADSPLKDTRSDPQCESPANQINFGRGVDSRKDEANKRRDK